MKIIVTGGAGFIGSHIVDQLIGAGHEVAVVDNLWAEGGGQERQINPAARFYRADILDENMLQKIFDQEQPTVVYHEAAQHSVAISTKDPVLDARVNVIGLLNVLHNCTRVGVSKIICAGSGASYGTPEQLPVTEETPQRPESPYGITKMVMEHYLRYWQQANGLRYTSLRYGNVFGPRQDPNGEAGVISIFARRFLAQEGVRIDWDGEQQKDYVYVGDVARANLLALDAGDNDIFCIGTGKGTSVNTIYETLAEITGFRPAITRAPQRPGDIYLSYFDYSKARRILQWQPETSFKEGVRRTVEFLRQADL
ncbi:MAG TPA: NAD-dependent epimerase/dehydratase family protein [Ktedonobacteraceae bacterium]|nr:NAD-dependent epimerase/dehydratase family protein [Ktedonobacteraceae bacterium]